MSFIERYHEQFIKDLIMAKNLQMTCDHCGKAIRPINLDNLDNYPEEISIAYYHIDKIGHLYFHVECFEEVAGSDYMKQLKEKLY